MRQLLHTKGRAAWTRVNQASQITGNAGAIPVPENQAKVFDLCLYYYKYTSLLATLYDRYGLLTGADMV